MEQEKMLTSDQTEVDSPKEDIESTMSPKQFKLLQDLKKSMEARQNGTYVRESSKIRRMLDKRGQLLICHYCGNQEPKKPLKVERELDGRRLRDKTGKTVYYHVSCKTMHIMSQVQAESLPVETSEEAIV